MADQVITCADCGQEFVFTESEQAFYADRGFTTPRRCAACRAAKKAARGDTGGGGSYGGSSYGGGSSSSYGGSRGPREMFTATCSSCGNVASVPFRPSGAKPVYCSDCFSRR
jgi:CxxC-x17-CxxC domain-containing protein